LSTLAESAGKASQGPALVDCPIGIWDHRKQPANHNSPSILLRLG